MSDTPDTTADVPAEAAQSAVQDDAPSQEAATQHPWGDDFDADRAWNTITHLRGREKELETAAKGLERLRGGEDQDAFRELAAAYGYEVGDDEPEPDTETDDGESPLESRLAELEQQWQERQAAESAKAFQADVDRLATEAELKLTERQVKWILRDALEDPEGFSPEATERAFKALVEDFGTLGKEAVEKHVKSKKSAPHVSQSGQPASQVPDLNNDKDRQAWMVERLHGGPAS